MTQVLFIVALVIVAVFSLMFALPALVILSHRRQLPVRESNFPTVHAERLQKWLLMSIRRTEKSLKIVTGWRYELAYNNELVINEMEAKLKRGVRIEIISGEKSDSCNKLEALAQKYPNHLFLHIYHGRIPGKHFRLSDDNFLIIEDPHERNAPNRKVTIVTSKTYHGEDAIEGYKIWFDQLLELAHVKEEVSSK